MTTNKKTKLQNYLFDCGVDQYTCTEASYKWQRLTSHFQRDKIDKFQYIRNLEEDLYWIYPPLDYHFSNFKCFLEVIFPLVSQHQLNTPVAGNTTQTASIKINQKFCSRI